MKVFGIVPDIIWKSKNLKAERHPTMESKKNQPGKARKMTGQVKPEPRQEPRSDHPKPNQTNVTDERPCY
jgi:hypothetical protein